jgi:hypothetical protein
MYNTQKYEEFNTKNPLYKGDQYGFNRETFSTRLDNIPRNSLANQIIIEQPVEEDLNQTIRIDLSIENQNQSFLSKREKRNNNFNNTI